MSLVQFASRVFIALTMVAGLLASPQERLFSLAGNNTYYGSVVPIRDHDHDGGLDIIASYSDTQTNIGGWRILNGGGGSLVNQVFLTRNALCRAVGDIDLDGMPDLACVGPGRTNGPQGEIGVYLTSFATNQVLWACYGSRFEQFAVLPNDTTLMNGDLDLDGDGRADFVVATYSASAPDVRAYNSSGTLLYRLPMAQLGWIPSAVTAMPDLDGDGCSEFLVGVIDNNLYGNVAVVSGRTGTILRISRGIAQGDYIGGAICNAGDVDQDGMDDYAAASHWFSPLTSIVIFSGRTGSPIRNWADYWTGSGGMLGNIDVDLDGVPDLIVANAGWSVSTFERGQIRAYSGRDGSILWNINAALPDLVTLAPAELINLGLQPGSPYPAFAFMETSWRESGPLGATTSVNRVMAYRTNLIGAGPVVGSPCSSNGAQPRIGMRQVPGHVRITVSGGLPGANAWLVGGPAAQTSYAGIQLPVGLDPLGLVGCTAYVAPVVVAPMLLGSTGQDRGYAAFDLPWASLSATGHALAAQWLMIDPQTGDYAMTARHDFRIP